MLIDAKLIGHAACLRAGLHFLLTVGQLLEQLLPREPDSRSVWRAVTVVFNIATTSPHEVSIYDARGSAKLLNGLQYMIGVLI